MFTYNFGRSTKSILGHLRLYVIPRVFSVMKITDLFLNEPNHNFSRRVLSISRANYSQEDLRTITFNVLIIQCHILKIRCRRVPSRLSLRVLRRRTARGAPRTCSIMNSNQVQTKRRHTMIHHHEWGCPLSLKGYNIFMVSFLHPEEILPVVNFLYWSLTFTVCLISSGQKKYPSTWNG